MAASSQSGWQTLPNDIPAPKDDGACDHLKPGNADFPYVLLPSTSGSSVDISSLSGVTIVFCYPRTARPDEDIPAEWNEIPGARGCTPQACSFRDLSREFLTEGVSHIFGVSTQDIPYQKELKERVHLPYQLLSDEKLELTKALNLPTFEWENKHLIRRLAMVVEDGKIRRCFYPVFPSDRSAQEVLQWLNKQAGRQALSNQAENEMMRNFQHRTNRS
ncbi:hypothetical protein K431DRAFT_270607 [Polychaeton citri CBS 116435]|uniref:Thioredoxin domain-containing protein n=1 Tax=Polychaeton citri CBS 116435 TaxID=1314669 RepID=A0A9P4Q9C7_9PEZI|nr:hypothetical protein K431DRAFT_270607 [Polychaeton citri CBS 116435]